VSEAENGAEQAEESGERRGAVSGSRKKAERGAGSRSGNEITEKGFKAERQKSPLRSHALVTILQSRRSL